MQELWAVSWNVDLWETHLSYTSNNLTSHEGRSLLNSASSTPASLVGEAGFVSTQEGLILGGPLESGLVTIDSCAILLSGLINQQETNVDFISINLLVGSSEAVRPQSYILLYCILSTPASSSRFNEWLAGVIDGDGCLLVSKAGYCSCEITMHLHDEPLLLRIKQALGGSVKLRAGMSAVRYRLHNKPAIIKLVHMINGHIRNSARVVQLQRVCTILGIDFVPSQDLDLNSAWYAGFFDAEGTVTFSMKEYGAHGFLRPQLSISVSNKKSLDVEMFITRFGGNVFFDKGSNSYKWYISSRADVERFLNYTKETRCIHSVKLHRLLLINKYYELVQLRAFAPEASPCVASAWKKFNNRWNKYS